MHLVCADFGPLGIEPENLLIPADRLGGPTGRGQGEPEVGRRPRSNRPEPQRLSSYWADRLGKAAFLGKRLRFIGKGQS